MPVVTGEKGEGNKVNIKGLQMFDSMDSNPWDDAEKMAFTAYEMYENGEMSDALEQLQQAIELNPTNPAWFFNAGLTLDSMDRFENAIAAYKHALELDPDDHEIMNSLAVDYTRVGQYDLALKIFEEIEQNVPDFEPAYCNRIITYAEMENHDKAEEMFYMAQQINPDCPICFYNIGNSLFTQQKYEKAIWCWERTAELEPTHPQINFRIAQAHWANGNTHVARTQFLEELRKNPGDTDVILDFGVFLLESGDIDAACEKFNRILEIEPDSASALLYLGDIALQQGDSVKAESLYQQSLKRNQAISGPRFRLAQLALTRGDKKAGLQYLNTELTLDIEDSEVLLSMGKLFIEFGDYDQAIDSLLQIVDRDPANAEGFYCLGLTLAKQDEYEGALQFYSHAVALGFDSADLMADMACLYLKTGCNSLAVLAAKDALKIEPQNKEMKKLLRTLKFSVFCKKIANFVKQRGGLPLKLLLSKYKCNLRRYFRRFSR
jgi:tetratricopeptide (TPR) repeat protein